MLDNLLKNVLALIDAKYSKDIEFEKEFGIAKSTVSAWRRGALKSYKNKSLELAQFFGVSLDELNGFNIKNKPTADKGSRLNEKLSILDDITEDFSPEEWAKLIDHAELLKSARK